MIHKIYQIKNYAFIKKEDYSKICLDFDNIEELIDELNTDMGYHFRILPNTKYIFFGDVDGYWGHISDFILELQEFLMDKYNLKFEKNEIYYTTNNEKFGSYHYSIPKWNLTTEKLKDIHQNFKKKFLREKQSIIDTSIYSDHWFRCPNQSKGNNTKGIHVISCGNMKDFIIDHIPKYSKNIDNVEYIEAKVICAKNDGETKIIKKSIEKTEKDDIPYLTNLLNLLDKEYYDDYNEWYKVGMILKRESIRINIDLFFLFDEFSKKSKKYDKQSVKKYWDDFKTEKISITLGSLNEYAKKSNSTEYKKIMMNYHVKNKIEITEKYICETLNKMAGNYFFYKNKILYSYNIHNKFWYEDATETMKQYINDELYDFIFEILNDCINDETYLSQQIKQLKNYCLKNKGQEEILKVYRTRYININNDIEFDSNPYLLGFTNGVYDIKNNEFRDYEYNDYITINTGYSYRKPNSDEKIKAEMTTFQIENDPDKRYLLYQILSTGLIGIAYRKFFIFNGAGGNGKSKLSDIMEVVLGRYFVRLNIGSLCGKDKKIDTTNDHTAGKNTLNKKRYCIFSEPAKDMMINNSRMKDLTGNKYFAGRKMNIEGEFKIQNHCTYILECNSKPKLAEEATEADIERIVDFLFESRFVQNNKDVNEKEKCYKADMELIEKLNFLKYGFLDIFIEKAYQFLTIDNCQFKIPLSVSERSKDYISSSYTYLEYLKEITIKTNEKDDCIQMNEFYNKIKLSDLYINSTKDERRKITLRSICDFFENNKNTMNNYKDRYRYYENGLQKEKNKILFGYKFIENNECQ
jgi:phage/plasmid-associated DNA primase